jgi:endo-1,4-beta-xylanase
MLDRRKFVAGAFGLALAPGVVCARGGELAVQGRSLATAAHRAGLYFGASADRNALTDAAYGELYLREVNLVVTDVAMKFDVLRPDVDHWRFHYADELLAAATEHKLPLRGHTLIWNDNAPDWLKRLNSREIERVFDEHVERVASRYAGKLHSWDVVNEPFWPMDRQPGGWRNGPWYSAMGPSYVERAFRRVAAVDKTACLTLNEAQCDNDHEWGRSIRPLLKGLVDRLLDAGVPLHAVGLQSHLQPQWPSNYVAFADYVAAFGAKGLDVYISEFDVNDESFQDDPAQRDAAVALTAAQFLAPVLKVPAVKAVICWQLSDRFSWYAELAKKKWPVAHRPPRPLPFDAALRAKPLRDALLEAFDARAARL